jgi:hypothetical protein
LDRPTARAFTSAATLIRAGLAPTVFARLAVAVLAQALAPLHMRCTGILRKVEVRLVQYVPVMIAMSSSDRYPNVIDGISDTRQRAPRP